MTISLLIRNINKSQLPRNISAIIVNHVIYKSIINKKLRKRLDFIRIFYTGFKIQIKSFASFKDSV